VLKSRGLAMKPCDRELTAAYLSYVENAENVAENLPRTLL
jgi:hypothetical protein